MDRKALYGRYVSYVITADYRLMHESENASVYHHTERNHKGAYRHCPPWLLMADNRADLVIFQEQRLHRIQKNVEIGFCVVQHTHTDPLKALRPGVWPWT